MSEPRTLAVIEWTLHPRSECRKCRDCAWQAARGAVARGGRYSTHTMLGSPAETVTGPNGEEVRKRATHTHKARIWVLSDSDLIELP